jgi:hypothetical protein
MHIDFRRILWSACAPIAFFACSSDEFSTNESGNEGGSDRGGAGNAGSRGGASGSEAGGASAGEETGGTSPSGTGGSNGGSEGGAGTGGDSGAGTSGDGGAGDGGSSGNSGGTAGRGGSSGGDAGSGAFAGMGGSAGAAGNPQVGCASPLVLDDMEDGNAWMCPSPNRIGDWFVTRSGGTTTPPMGHGALPVLIPSGRGSSRYGMRLTGTGFTGAPEAVAIIGVDVRGPSGTAPYNATVHRGITFWARAQAALRIRVKFATVASAENLYGGTCIPTTSLPCNDHYRKQVDFTANWQPFTVSFETDLSQELWGVTVPKDLAHLLAITFDYSSTAPNPRSFELWIDDIEFY